MEATLKITSDFYEIIPEEKDYNRSLSFTKEEILTPKKIFWEKIKSFLKKTTKKEGAGKFYIEGQSAHIENYIISKTFVLIDDLITFQPVDIINNFNLYNKEEIQIFISAHPEINNYLEKAVSIIKNYFKVKKLELQLVGDPEFKNGEHRTLFLYIPTKLDPPKALELLGKIDKYLFEEMKINPIIFNINLRFI